VFLLFFDLNKASVRYQSDCINLITMKVSDIFRAITWMRYEIVRVPHIKVPQFSMKWLEPHCILLCEDILLTQFIFTFDSFR